LDIIYLEEEASRSKEARKKLKMVTAEAEEK